MKKLLPDPATYGVTAVAAGILGVAADDLLRGQGDGGMVAQDPHGLDLLGCAERPARTALLLVLHGGDAALGAPVIRGGDGHSGALGHL